MESNILRLALIMEDQSATTLDKYVCKLVECVLFYLQDKQLSSVELCTQIKEQFQLEFDVLEIENAIRNKARGQIILTERKYQLSPKAIEQLSKQRDPNSLLKNYISQFLFETGKQYDADILLAKMQEYLYFCFNSSKENLLSLLQTLPATVPDSFSASNELVQQINDFIAWENTDKNKLLYDIISFSYEYCMLTTKKDALLSKKIFRGKKFYLDANIIFRMAGVNKDERQFVTESFIKKCNEVGIGLYYTSETLTEIYRVIDGQISYIRSITQNQAPVDSRILQSIDSTNEINDFYALYYKWCQEPQNKYRDYLSFQKYLIGLIRDVIDNLQFVQIPNYPHENDTKSFDKKCTELEAFKREKRPTRNTSKASIQTDINNLLYISLLRGSATTANLWQTNEYFVSADQLLTNWSKTTHSGVPIVVIPSTWLSIILRFSGRSENDYKAYCLFMSLRQHKSEEDAIYINPIPLLAALGKRTSDQNIKQCIIEEIINNKSAYSISRPEDYPVVIQNAFDAILRQTADDLRVELTSKIDSKEKENSKKIENLNEQLKARSTMEETVTKIANNKAERKILFWKRVEFIQYFFPAITVLLIILALYVYFKKLQPIYNWISALAASSTSINGATPWGLTSWLITVLISVAPNALFAPLKYLASENRKTLLVKKFEKQARRDLQN